MVWDLNSPSNSALVGRAESENLIQSSLENCHLPRGKLPTCFLWDNSNLLLCHISYQSFLHRKLLHGTAYHSSFLLLLLCQKLVLRWWIHTQWWVIFIYFPPHFIYRHEGTVWRIRVESLLIPLAALECSFQSTDGLWLLPWWKSWLDKEGRKSQWDRNNSTSVFVLLEIPQRHIFLTWNV